VTEPPAGWSFLLRGAYARAMVTNFLFFGSMNGFLLLPLYLERLGGTEAEIGLVQGMYSAAGIACQPLVGLWVDRIGRRQLMLVGTGLLTAAAAGCMAVVSFPVLALLRALHGIAFSAFFVANYLHVVDLVPPGRRGWALGIYGLSGLVSTALAPAVGELIIRHAGFVPAFALSTAVGALALWLIVRSHDARPPSPGAGPGLAELGAGLGELRRAHMVVGFFFGVASGTVFTFLPSFGERLGVRGLGLFYTAYAGAAIAVRLGGGSLIDSRGRRAVIVPSMFVVTAGTGILALVAAGPAGPVLPFLVLAGLLAGAAHGFLFPALSALLVDVTPEGRRGSAVGIFSAAVLAGNALGSVSFGYVAHGLGFGAMWGLLTAVLLVGLRASLALGPAGPAAGARAC
jgi:MFS family permease